METPIKKTSTDGSQSDTPNTTNPVLKEKNPKMLSTQLAWQFMPKRDWRDDAFCIDMPSNIFYGEGDEQMTSKQISFAKSICKKCPVQRDCLIVALKANEAYGVWGGYATFERRTALKRNNGQYVYAVIDFDNDEFIKPRKSRS